MRNNEHIIKVPIEGKAYHKYYFLFYTFILSLFIFHFVSCSSQQHSNKKIFHYNETTGIASLDPAFAKNQSTMWVAHQLYNTLIEVDETMQMKPSLAKNWQIAEDNLSIIFNLRTDVFFTDDPAFTNGKGRRLNAIDVVYSLSLIHI